MRSTRLLWFALALLLVVILPISSFAQTVTDENGVVVKIHRFQPVVAAAAAPAPGAAAKKGELSDAVKQQISTLEQEKQSRTATQKKISSRVLYAARMLQGQPVAPGIPTMRSNLELDEQNNLFVDIRARVSDDLLGQLRSLGVRIISTDSRRSNVRAFVPANKLETIAAFPEVIFISPRREAMTVGSGAPSFWLRPVLPGFAQRAARVREKVAAQLARKGDGLACAGQGSQTSEGYTTHQAVDACGTFGVTGAGIKIGVLSDGVTSLALSQGTGDLGPVTVLPGQTGSGDEGTAMLEIIHDLAPGATLYFATAFTSIESFAQNIVDLRTAGCDIIVDDVIYFVETPFQDGQDPSVVSTWDGGVVVQAVNDVVTDGAMYFSSAGNAGNKDDATSGTYEGDFVDGGANALLPGGTVAKFGTTAYDQVAATGGGGAIAIVHWSDPLGGSDNDYDLYILNSTGTTIVDGSVDIQDGTQDPVEGTSVFAGERIVIYKPTAAAARFLHITAFSGELSVSTSGAIIGHAGATGGFAIGATPAHLAIAPGYPVGPYPNPFDDTDVVEPYSSDGPRHIFFEADGTAITPGNFSSTGGTVLPKPEFTAADGVAVTGVGGFGSPFYGTSAAAPHAAAIAGLIKSADNTLTNSDVVDALTSTAIDIEGAGTDRDSGAGIVMALGAVQAALSPQITTLSPVQGDVGTPVTLTGSKFGATQGGSTVTFNGTAGVPTNWADGSITVPVPAGATNGPVVVTVNGLASNADKVFTFTPSISGLSVDAAPIGTPITITGTNFGATQGTSTVKFNGTTATVTTWSMTSIVANVPASATNGNVVVTINGIASNGMAFTVQDFAFDAPLTDITVTAGQSGSEDFTIDSATGFDAAITLTCTGAPGKATCTLTPNSVAAGGTPATVHLAVTTTAATSSGAKPGLLGLWLPFGGIGLVLGAGAASRKRSRKAMAALGLFVLLPLLAAIVSCGGSDHHAIPGTPTGTYTLTVRAAATGGTTHTSTLKLKVN